MDLPNLLSELKRRFDVHEFKDGEDQGKTSCTNRSVGTGTGDQEGIGDQFWVDTFHQVYVEKFSKERDDLLFIVKWDAKQKCEQVEVFRREASSLPSPRDDTVLWENTLYLNLLLHEFKYHVTCGVVNVEDGVVVSVTKRVELQVYPTLNQRSMDKKDTVSDLVYPNVTFCVDNFEDAFGEICSNVPGEKIAVQLIASSEIVGNKKLVFLGAIDHAVLKDAYEQKDQTRASGLGSKLKRFSLKPRHSRVFDVTVPYHFIRMRGPHMKGFAEVAVWKEDLSLSKLQTYTPSSAWSSDSTHFFGSSDSHSSHPDKPRTLHNNSLVLQDESEAEDDHRDNSSTTLPTEGLGGLSKLKSLWSRKSAKKSEKRYTTSTSGIRMHAYLTFVQLPWHTLVDDILNCTKENAL